MRYTGTRLTGSRLAAAVLVAVLAVAGCHGRSAPPTPSSDVITKDELLRSTALNAYEAVERLRPQFFKSRGRTTFILREQSSPVVYFDDRRIGDVAALRDLALVSVYEIRYISASMAQQRFGSGHPAGAILVYSAKRSN